MQARRSALARWSNTATWPGLMPSWRATSSPGRSSSMRSVTTARWTSASRATHRARRPRASAAASRSSGVGAPSAMAPTVASSEACGRATACKRRALRATLRTSATSVCSAHSLGASSRACGRIKNPVKASWAASNASSGSSPSRRATATRRARCACTSRVTHPEKATPPSGSRVSSQGQGSVWSRRVTFVSLGFLRCPTFGCVTGGGSRGGRYREAPKLQPGAHFSSSREWRSAQDRDAVAEDLLDPREQVVRRGDLVVVGEVEHRLAALRDLHAQRRAAGAGVGAQELLEGLELLALDDVGVEADVEEAALLGADAREELGVHEAQALARGLAVAEGRVDEPRDEQRLVAAQELAVVVDLLRAHDVLDLARVVLERHEGVLAAAVLHGAFLVARDDAREDHLRALALLEAGARRRVRVALDLAREPVERVAADVEAQRLLLVGEQLLGHPFVAFGVLVLEEPVAVAVGVPVRPVLLVGRAAAEQRQQARLTALALALRLGGALARHVDRAENPGARHAVREREAVEGARLAQRLEHLAVDLASV